MFWKLFLQLVNAYTESFGRDHPSFHIHTIHVDVGPGVLVASRVDAVLRAEKRPAEVLPVV